MPNVTLSQNTSPITPVRVRLAEDAVVAAYIHELSPRHSARRLGGRIVGHGRAVGRPVSAASSYRRSDSVGACQRSASA